MKKYSPFLLFYLFFHLSAKSQSGISINEDGSLPNESSILDIKSTDKGLLIPRLVSNPVTLPEAAQGLIIYNISDNSFYYNTSLTTTPNWVKVTNSDEDDFIKNQKTSNQNANFRINGIGIVGDSLGIGVVPNYKLHLSGTGALEPISVFESTNNDVSIRLYSGYAGGGEVYVEYQSDFTSTNGWQTGLNDNSVFVFRYGGVGTIGPSGTGLNQASHKLGLTSDGKLILKNDGTSVGSLGSRERLNLISNENEDFVSILFRTNDDNTGTALFDAMKITGGWHQTSSTAYGQQSLSIESYNGTTWDSQFMVRGDGRVGIGTSTPSQLLDINGWIKLGDENVSTPPNSNDEGSIRYNSSSKNIEYNNGGTSSDWIQLAPVYDAVPKGVIVMWSGPLATIPTNWALCDGSNGTPDLRDKFILGATNSSDIGQTGGNHSYSLTVDQLPSHNHTGTTNNTTPSLTFIGSTGTTSSNGEGWIRNMLWDDGATYQASGTLSLSAGSRTRSWSGTSGNAMRQLNISNHTHTFTPSGTISGGSHNHPFTTNNTGSNSSIDNRPSFYRLYYIMKL